MDQPDSSGDNCSIYHNIVDKVGDHFYQRLHSIEELCDSMDLPHTTRDHRMNRMFKSITNFIERLHQNELNQLMGEFTVRRNQVNIMLRSLSLDPYIPDRAKSFLSQSKELTAKYYELIRTRNNRLKQMKDMCEELASVQMLLGEAYVKPNSEKDIPSKVELDQLRSVLKRKRNQLTTVQTHCDHLRRQMIKIQADIDFEANFQEEELLTSSTIIYKHSVVKRIENLYQKLCTLQSEAEIELEMLKRKFVQLCYLLEIDDQLFTTFTDSLKGSINEKQDFYRKRISAFVELRQTKQVNLFRNEFKPEVRSIPIMDENEKTYVEIVSISSELNEKCSLNSSMNKSIGNAMYDEKLEFKLQQMQQQLKVNEKTLDELNYEYDELVEKLFNLEHQLELSNQKQQEMKIEMSILKEKLIEEESQCKIWQDQSKRMQLLYEQCYSQLNNKFSNDDDKNESNLKLNVSKFCALQNELHEIQCSNRLKIKAINERFNVQLSDLLQQLDQKSMEKLAINNELRKFRKKLKISNNESEEINILMQSKLDSAERRLKDNRIRIDELEEQCLKEVKNRRKIQRELDYANQLISNNHHIAIKQDNNEQMLN